MGSHPNILILTTGCLSLAHGTGARLLNQFATYPSEHLWNVFAGYQGEPALAQHLWVRRYDTDWRSELRRWRRKLLHIQPQNRGMDMREIRSYLNRKKWYPDLIYATCLCRDDLEILASILQQYNHTLPVIQHFLDWHPDDPQMLPLLKKINPYLSQVWALTEAMQTDISQILHCPVSVVSVFHCDLPTIYKHNYSPYDANFRAVIIGNCGYTEILDDLAQAWRILAHEFTNLQPIHWYAHPRSWQCLQERNYQLPAEIQYRGFIPETELMAKLSSYDLALIPFNRCDTPESWYARYSSPSRMTELASVGLPLCLLAGEETAAAQYVAKNDLGVVVNPSDQTNLITTLESLLKNQELRQELGQKSRRFAEANFNVLAHRKLLFETFAQLLQHPTEM
ncbi:hypothetical protein [Gloeomargarita lithophora]|nr:hypothetical protein [Gloeomargarita lithophora]